MSDPSHATVFAVVVTYNRRDLLTECLAALKAQTHRLQRIVVVDNASTDGTVAMVRDEHPDVDLVALEQNEGGAGGFHEGMKRAHESRPDWIWLLDDDTIAAPTALEEMLAAPGRLGSELPEPVMLASKVLWTDEHLHPMNAPNIDRRDMVRLVSAHDHGVVPLRASTFVSLLLKGDLVDDYGLPLKHFFIWSDDIEFTARILRTHFGCLVPESIVHHKTKQPYTAVHDTGGRFYFHVRNSLYMVRGSAWAIGEKLSLLLIVADSSFAYLRRNRFKPSNVAVVLRGLRDGLRPAPR